MINIREAYSYLIDNLRNPRKSDYADYDCDIYIPNITLLYQKEHSELPQDHITSDYPAVKASYPSFQDAAFQLCRMGIIRPGTNLKGHSNNNPFNGYGFSLTEQGREWLKKVDSDFISQSPSHFSELFKQYNNFFGVGFIQRAEEACKAYQSGCYLATCVMCGSAAESILLQVAIKNEPMNENKILTEYKSANGTRKLFNRISGKLAKDFQDKLNQLSELLKYRRDASGHGEIVQINEFDAYDSISRLIRLSGFIKDNWDKIATEV